MPAGPDPGAGNLANLTLAPGDYTAAAGTFMIPGAKRTPQLIACLQPDRRVEVDVVGSQLQAPPTN